MFNGSVNHFVPDDMVCWGAWSDRKGIGKTRADSHVNYVLGLTGGGGLGEVEVVFFPAYFHGWKCNSSFKRLFKYFSMLVDKHMTLKVSDEHAVQAYVAAQQRIKKSVWVYGIPAGMYARQVWGTEYLREASEFKSQLQKMLLGAFSTCEDYCQKLANTDMLDSNSETLRQVLKADSHLADRNDSCWSAHVSKAFSGMCDRDMFIQKR
eukprot:1145964-Pelagomonas_calceolata.AAC.1